MKLDRFEKTILAFAIICILLFTTAWLAYGQCPKDRASVKMLTDGVVLPLTPVNATIKELTALPEPKGKWLHMPRQEAEKKYYRVAGMLTACGVEKDGDYHLVLSDGRRTMIAEIPNPACLPSDNSHAPLYAIARHTLDSVLGKKLWNGVKQIKPRSIEVCGIGFIDKKHGQAGCALNGFEIHPVLFLKFLGDN